MRIYAKPHPRARLKREMLNVRAWRLDIFLVLLKRRNEEKSFSEKKRERERKRRRGRRER